MKITVLTYVEQPDSKDVDPVVAQVGEALAASGHTTSVLAVHSDLKQLTTGLARRKPDLVFNLLEMFGDNILAEVSIAGLLDLLGVKHTGCGPGEFYLQQDKALTKKLLAFDHILYPDFAVFSEDASLETGGNLRMPLFVKPLRADASIGIDGRSLVRGSTEMIERVLFIHKELHDSALAEEFIEGREFYVGVLGNTQPVAFPPIEMDFSGLNDQQPHVLDGKAKWDQSSDQFKGTRAVVADLPDELRARLQGVALDAYRALRVRDYGRVDIRMTEAGEIYVIEVNASCYLERSGEFATAAAASGLQYNALINRIVELALERYQAPESTRRSRRRKRSASRAP